MKYILLQLADNLENVPDLRELTSTMSVVSRLVAGIWPDFRQYTALLAAQDKSPFSNLLRVVMTTRDGPERRTGSGLVRDLSKLSNGIFYYLPVKLVIQRKVSCIRQTYHRL